MRLAAEGLRIFGSQKQFMASFILYPSASRGSAHFGWLDSFHSFSFGHYYNPNRMGFGALRVLNDDRVAPGMGFGKHPHHNMEIVSIPLSGSLKHRDSMGNETIIRPGEVQIMSAGTGVEHSEFNNSIEEEVRFLQIWVIPNQENIPPRYDQIALSEHELENTLFPFMGPGSSNLPLSIHQNAWFSMGKLDAGKSFERSLQSKGNGVFLFCLEGSASINGCLLNRRDAMEIRDADSFEIIAQTEATLLAIEVPMA
jgi:redox-sensitive bicupin YhaK (pirin superfamily)